MKLYDAGMPAPNPRRVRMYLAEKGIDVPLVKVSMLEGEHKRPEYIALNSLGQVPVLELDDGTAISETVSICRYFEALHPEPPLFGRTPVEIARIDMWIRRIEFQLMNPISQVWINVHPYTERFCAANGITRYAAFGEDNRKRALNRMKWLNGELAGHEFIAGDAFTMADIAAISVIDFAKFIGIEIPAEAEALSAWHARVSARPSAAA